MLFAGLVVRGTRRAKASAITSSVIVPPRPTCERGGLQRVERPPRVAVGLRARASRSPPASPRARAAQAAIPVAQSAARTTPATAGGVERLEHKHLAAREQRRIEAEAGILGRRADQGDGAPLDVGKEGVLLGPVEAVDLVTEQDRAPAEPRGAPRPP